MDWYLDARVESALRENKIINTAKIILGDRLDLSIHAQKSGDTVNYFALYDSLKFDYDKIYGNNKRFIFDGDYYDYKQLERHITLYNQCWNIFEARVPFIKNYLRKQNGQ